MPRSFANGITGPVTTRIVAGAGHLAELDKPVEVAGEILGFTD